MSKPIAAVLALLLAMVGPAHAQEATAGWNPRSGDAWIDAQLADVNRYGARYREAFIDEIVRYHAAPRGLVAELVVRDGWAPGDVYFACALAEVAGRPCRYVVEAWKRDRTAGWGAVAERLGVAVGTEAFARLKRGFVPTYARWARPISLDDELRRAWPKHPSATVVPASTRAARGIADAARPRDAAPAADAPRKDDPR